jgi:cytochrome P450
VVYFVGDPENFRPERFLSPDGKSLEKKKGQHVIPFSLGKRACLGETLARVEFFLFLTSVVQAFRIEFDPEIAPSEVENAPSLFRFTPPFKVAFIERIVL